jgi:hypothetical protein
MQEIGRVIGTEKRPNTAYTFFFWTEPGSPVGIGSLVRVAADEATVYGTVVEAHGFNDLESPLHEFMSMGGRAGIEPPTVRPEMRVFQAAVLRRDPEEPVGAVPIGKVYLADEADVRTALRTDGYADDYGIPCGCYGAKDSPVAVHLHSHFLLGPESGHLNITGTSGLAAKTSYILFLLKSIFDRFRAAGFHAEPLSTAEAQRVDGFEGGVAALLFNTKGGDLLYIDQEPPAGYLTDDDRRLYAACGVSATPFEKVRYYCPLTKGGNDLNTIRNNEAGYNGKPTKPFTFGLKDVIRHAEVLLNRDDLDAKADAYLEYLNDRFVETERGHQIGGEGELHQARTLNELVEIIRLQLRWCESRNMSQMESHNMLTIRKMYNRIGNLGGRFAGLIAEDGSPTGPFDQPFQPDTVYVVDVAQLSSEEQDLVFSAFITNLREKMENGELGVGRLVVVVDELNKYAPTGAMETYVVKSLKEIAARGRYLGLTLFGAQQFRSRVDKEIVGNAATHAFGHIEAEELAQPGYSYFTPAVKQKLGSLEQGAVLIKHPHFAQPVFIRFPRPACLKGSDGLKMYPRKSGRTFVDQILDVVNEHRAPLNTCKDMLADLSDSDETLLEVLRKARRAKTSDDVVQVLKGAPRKAAIGRPEPKAVVAQDVDPFA